MNNFYRITLSVDGRIIVKNEHAMSFPAQMPIVSGHVLISPIRPVKNIEDLSLEEHNVIFKMMATP